MAKRRVTGPTKKLNGISVPVHLLSLLEDIRQVETEAFEEMDGETKLSTSDLVSLAIEGYVKQWLEENGAPPAPKSVERKGFVKKLAETNLLKLREKLLEEQASPVSLVPSKH